MRRAGLVVVLLGLLVDLVPRGYYAAINLEVVDPPSDFETFETVNKVTSALGVVAVVVLVLGVLMLLAARSGSGPRTGGASYPAPGGGYGAPQGGPRNPPPPTYLS